MDTMVRGDIMARGDIMDLEDTMVRGDTEAMEVTGEVGKQGLSADTDS